MDFTDTPEQAALRESVRGFLRKYATADRIRQAAEDPLGRDRPTWDRLTGELGLTALAVPESHDGMGATFAEVAIAVEELGRVLLPSPYLSTALVGVVLGELAGESPEAAARFLPGLAAGTLIGAFALAGPLTARHDGGGHRVSGLARHVVDGPQADVIVARAGDALFAVRAEDVTVTPVGTLDQTRRQAIVEFADAPALPLGADAGPAAADRAEDLVRTALAVECAGAADRCIATTVDFLRTRVQFGRPIGTFQALKHRCADLAVEVASARAVARAAVAAAVEDPAEFAIAAPLANLHCAAVFQRVAGEMIQLHGGVGFTWEHEAHLYFKRAKSTRLLSGSTSQLRTLVGRRAGLLG